jgi:signal peptidase I
MPPLTSGERAETSGPMRSPKSRRGRPNAARTPAGEEKESAGSLLRFVLILVVLAWALRSFVVAPFNIPSGSMLPTLYIGDYLIVAKWPYGYSSASFPFGFPSFHGRVLGHLPKRGDVVVFRHPGGDSDLIKRVIALPGDTIAVRNGDPILNGHPLPRQRLPAYKLPISANSPCRSVAPAASLTTMIDAKPYCLFNAYRETLPGGPSYTVLDQVEHGPADDVPTMKIPPGRVFMMGDNRDDSLDSRFALADGGVGMVPVENLIGRALVTFWSTDGSAYWWKPWTWFSALRASRVGNTYTDAAQ